VFEAIQVSIMASEVVRATSPVSNRVVGVLKNPVAKNADGLRGRKMSDEVAGSVFYEGIELSRVEPQMAIDELEIATKLVPAIYRIHYSCWCGRIGRSNTRRGSQRE
jgi:hypothetical protein